MMAAPGLPNSPRVATKKVTPGVSELGTENEAVHLLPKAGQGADPHYTQPFSLSVRLPATLLYHFSHGDQGD